MSTLTKRDKAKIEKFLEMSSGYVLDFSNRTFATFILDSIGIDIDEDKYAEYGSSKANRLRKLLDTGDDYLLGKLITDFAEYWREKQNDLYKLWPGLDTDKQQETLCEECLKIAKRLLDNSEAGELASVSAHFEDIQGRIIAEIQDAKFMIWIAVAWFTDHEIFSNLLDRLKQGVNIQLIINDDNINSKSGLNYDKFETYRMIQTGKYANIMHHKFCVIDLKKVIHGSYNWTNKARFNQENITVVNDRKIAEEFAEEFLELKRKFSKSRL